MKKCPFCGEEIRDEAIKCRFCGEFLEEKKHLVETKLAESVEGITRQTKSANAKSRNAFALFLILSIFLSIIILAFQTRNSFPFLSLVVTIIGIAGFLFSIKIRKKNKFRSTKILAFSIPLFLLGTLYFIGSFNIYSTQQKQEKQAKLEQKKREEERQKQIQYNIEHKEEYYQEGLALIKEKKYSQARGVFERVISVDENYKDVKAQIKFIDETLARLKREKDIAGAKAKREKEIADAKRKILEAEKLSRSKKCFDMEQAIIKCKQALKTLPDSKNAKEYLLRAQLNLLRCFKGNSKIKMAVEIGGYRPLKLYIWIKNTSNEVRHANPTYFTLVTVRNKSHSVSSETYGLSSYFDAVDLQPGTETSGAIIFDTRDKPKKLVYSELLGTKISREFPFD